MTEPTGRDRRAETPRESGQVTSGHAETPGEVGAEVFAALRKVSTATVTTQLFARGLRNTFLAGLRPLNPAHTRMVGEAFTLRHIPAREDLDVLSVFKDYDHPQRLAVESVGPGQVLVMDCRGQTRAASIGGILATRLLRRGAAGLVTDGAVRDSPFFAGLELPAFAAGVCATTNLARHHAVDLQVPIGCAEVPVYPGDVIVADAEGVVCVPRHLAAEVARDALEQERLEDFIQAQVEAGAPLRGTYPPDEETLRRYRSTLPGGDATR
ncbi:ribonuclease activity regulator RraA [Sphaerisporangium sp. NBC_01403]|uniref:ribonuclease activity regulator RraA n=1 Tax=Sphaerisporangium sp. NBC_01403 TaxID=2903599 RepID=UPI003245D29E